MNQLWIMNHKLGFFPSNFSHFLMIKIIWKHRKKSSPFFLPNSCFFSFFLQKYFFRCFNFSWQKWSFSEYSVVLWKFGCFLKIRLFSEYSVIFWKFGCFHRIRFQIRFSSKFNFYRKIYVLLSKYSLFFFPKFKVPKNTSLRYQPYKSIKKWIEFLDRDNCYLKNNPSTNGYKLMKIMMFRM